MVFKFRLSATVHKKVTVFDVVDKVLYSNQHFKGNERMPGVTEW